MNTEKYRPEDYSDKRGVNYNWDSKERAQYGYRLYKTIKENGLFPPDMDGFVFLSVSANKGTKELELAKSLEEDIKDKHFNKKPLVISADMAHVKNSHNQEGENYVLADARKIPLIKESVDIIFDRMGAIWYASWEENKNCLIKLLDEMSRALKKHGKILVEATNSISTDAIMMRNFNVKDSNMLNAKLKELGFQCSYLGEGLDRILVLEKID